MDNTNTNTNPNNGTIDASDVNMDILTDIFNQVNTNTHSNNSIINNNNNNTNYPNPNNNINTEDLDLDMDMELLIALQTLEDLQNRVSIHRSRNLTSLDDIIHNNTNTNTNNNTNTNIDGNVIGNETGFDTDINEIEVGPLPIEIIDLQPYTHGKVVLTLSNAIQNNIDVTQQYQYYIYVSGPHGVVAEQIYKLKPSVCSTKTNNTNTNANTNSTNNSTNNNSKNINNEVVVDIPYFYGNIKIQVAIFPKIYASWWCKKQFHFQ